MYLLAIALVLASSSWILKLVGGILAGIKKANFSTLDHDAAHNSITRLKKLNKYIAIIEFTPGLFNYVLWSVYAARLKNLRVRCVPKAEVNNCRASVCS